MGRTGGMGPPSLAGVPGRASARQAGERRMGRAVKTLLIVAAAATVLPAQATKEPDWKVVEEESIRQFQAVLRIDTRSPPGNEHLVAEYLKQLFDKEGIPAKILA